MDLFLITLLVPSSFSALANSQALPKKQDFSERFFVAQGAPGEKAEEPEKELTPLQKKFLDYYNEEMKAIKPASLNQTYTVNLKDGKKIQGRYIAKSSAGVTFEMLDGSTKRFNTSQLKADSYKIFYPKEYAKLRAKWRIKKELLADKQEELAAKKQEDDKKLAEDMANQPKKEEPKKTVNNPNQFKSGSTTITIKGGRKYYSGPSLGSKYDTTKIKIPEEFKTLMVEYATWIHKRSKYAGAPITSGLYVNRFMKDIVLYIEVSRAFSVQNKAIRISTTEGLWKKWEKDLTDFNLIRSSKNAHLVLIDEKGRIVGGTNIRYPGNFDKIWVIP